MGLLFLIFLVAIGVIIYRNYHNWFLKKMERKRIRLEYQDLQFDLTERKSYLMGQIFDLKKKWEYHLKQLEIIQSKNDTSSSYEIQLKKLDIMKELAAIEEIRLNTLSSSAQKRKTEELLEQSNQNLLKLYEDLNLDMDH